MKDSELMNFITEQDYTQDKLRYCLLTWLYENADPHDRNSGICKDKYKHWREIMPKCVLTLVRH